MFLLVAAERGGGMERKDGEYVSSLQTLIVFKVEITRELNRKTFKALPAVLLLCFLGFL